MLVPLICPTCRQALSKQGESWNCTACQRRYPIRKGVVCFLDSGESFNEGEFQENQEQFWSETAKLRDRIRHSKLLSFVNRLRIRFSMSGRRDRVFFKEMQGKGSDRLILDVGCGGGRHYFCDYGKVVGIDPLLDLLQISKTIYSEVYQASALELPFAENSFDYVVSSDVIGHIPTEIKDRMFAEMYRVLKKGGRTVHVIETDSQNCWFRFAHRHPDLFRRYFVDGPGHISLELPSTVRDRFLKQGFKEVVFRKYSGVIQECGMLKAFFDNEYKTNCGTLRFLVGVDALLSKNMLVKESANLLLEPVAQLCDYFSPFDHGAGALVVFEK